MRVMTERHSRLLDKLVRCAYGNVALVDEAIRNCAYRCGGRAKLDDVVEYIKTHRKPSLSWYKMENPDE